MPNGESKNWVRFLITLERFYVLHGKWPTAIHVYPSFIDELQEKLSVEDFNRLQFKIKLIPNDENSFYSFDDADNKYSYGQKDSPNGSPHFRAIEWLKISEPDYYD